MVIFKYHLPKNCSTPPLPKSGEITFGTYNKISWALNHAAGYQIQAKSPSLSCHQSSLPWQQAPNHDFHTIFFNMSS